MLPGPPSDQVLLQKAINSEYLAEMRRTGAPDSWRKTLFLATLVACALGALVLVVLFA